MKAVDKISQHTHYIFSFGILQWWTVLFFFNMKKSNILCTVLMQLLKENNLNGSAATLKPVAAIPPQGQRIQPLATISPVTHSSGTVSSKSSTLSWYSIFTTWWETSLLNFNFSFRWQETSLFYIIYYLLGVSVLFFSFF